MPRAGAEVAGNDLAGSKTPFAHGGFATAETKNGVVLAVAKLQVIGVFFVAASVCPAKMLIAQPTICRTRCTDFLALTEAVSSYSPSSPVFTPSK